LADEGDSANFARQKYGAEYAQSMADRRTLNEF
jgi:hypothetical protein